MDIICSFYVFLYCKNCHNETHFKRREQREEQERNQYEAFAADQVKTTACQAEASWADALQSEQMQETSFLRPSGAFFY